MSDFSEIRSIMNKTSWTSTDIVKHLLEICKRMKTEEPILWMTQVAPYIASFQDKWDSNVIRVRTAATIRSTLSTLPCVWFSYAPTFAISVSIQNHYGTRVKHLDLSGNKAPTAFKDSWAFLDQYPDLTRLKCSPHSNSQIPFSNVIRLWDRTIVPPLTHLSLPHCRVRTQDLEFLAQKGLLNDITHLDLSFNSKLTSIPYDLIPNLQELAVVKSGISKNYPSPSDVNVIFKESLRNEY